MGKREEITDVSRVLKMLGQGWVGPLRREQGKPPGCKTAGEPVGGVRCPPEDFGAIHAFTECPLQENHDVELAISWE